MEEIFEIIVGMISVGAVITGAAKKKGKKAKSKAKSRKTTGFDWDSLIEQAAGIQPQIPYAPSPAPQAQPEPEQLEMLFAPESAVQPEPEPPVMEGPAVAKAEPAPAAPILLEMRRPRPTQPPVSRTGLNPARLREAVVMSEVLGRPVSLRRNSGRV